MNEAKLVHGLDGKNTLGHVKLGDILGKRVVLDQHRHQVSTGQKLHHEVEVVGVLKRIVELDDPCGIRFGEDVAFGADVGQLARGR